MKKLLVGVIVLASLGIGGAAWAAGPPYTVQVGGIAAGPPDAYTATSTGTVRMQVKNNAGLISTMNCTSLSMTGYVTKGTNINPWASILSTTWTGCTFVGGAYTVTQPAPMNLAGTGTNATPSYETIQGHIGDAGWNFATSATPAVCSFQVRGASSSVPGIVSDSFNETAQVLTLTETTFTGNLKTYNVSGCLGQLQNNNPVNLMATLNVSATGGFVNLS